MCIPEILDVSMFLPPSACPGLLGGTVVDRKEKNEYNNLI